MQRPASVAVIAMLGVVGGLILMVGAVIAFVLIVNPDGLYEWIREKPYYNAHEYDKLIVNTLDTYPLTRLVVGVQGALLGVLGIVLLIGARQLLRLQEQGRRLVLGFALAWLICKGVFFAVDQLYYAPLRINLGIPVSRDYGIPLDIAYALAALYVLTRPSIVQVMRSRKASPAEPSGHPI
ncbi:MAG: hypothetical protein ACK4RG_03670 [Fimbriimonadales bacterium]